MFGLIEHDTGCPTWGRLSPDMAPDAWSVDT
jgi:hypothetical protein